MAFLDLEEHIAELFGELETDADAGAGWRAQTYADRNRRNVRQWRQTYPERYLAYKRSYYASNRERLAAKQREYNARKRELKCATQSSTKVS